MGLILGAGKFHRTWGWDHGAIELDKGRIARIPQSLLQLLDVVTIACFEDQLCIHLPERGLRKDSLLLDMQDIGFVAGHQVEEPRQTARSIADGDS